MGHRRRILPIAGVIVCAVAAAVAIGTSGADAPAHEAATAVDRGAERSGTSASRDAGEPAAFETRVARIARSGVLGPDDSIAVANLTVRPGQYVVRYSFEARVDSPYRPLALNCGIVDNNGLEGFLADGEEPVAASGEWRRFEFETTFSLPDITIGIRCVPTELALARASFRDVELSVTRDRF